MRCECVVVLCLAVVVLVLCGEAFAAPGPSYSKGQTKPRAIRGFKNVVLSTARNFGKRGGSDAQGEYVDEAALQANGQDYQRPPSSFPVQWFVEEIQNNPDLARGVVRKFIDENQDGELSAEELLRSVY
ncbi:allatotropins-like [Thrips palmi]|uniref:Allatotropins-like n=1 Tax=Thrips palmi TaxID=161013 RepID=A0A6P8ZX16_THRPL|nr:allatotropins-like [Thrips palmi]